MRRSCLALLAIALPCRAVSPASLHSSVSLLFQNNLNFTDDVNHIGALLLDPMSQSAAKAACESLNESLLSSQAIRSHTSDILNALTFLAFEGKPEHRAGQPFWVDSGTVSLDRSGKDLQFSNANSRQSKFAVLCSQSSTGTTQATSTSTATNKISVSSRSNTFTGFRNKKSFRFLGIPFSEPVVRFQHSVVNTQTATSFDATKFGSVCFQSGAGPFSEQCLFLNIFTPFLPSPSTAKKDLKPVVVWIHGGAFTSGTGADATFDGGNLASRGDVVVITINYRLSSIGFLALPNTTITGNFGIGDQVTALEWIQQNIAAFGGDKDRVTIWGQSAGAGSVRTLLGSPKAIGKFAAAVPSSNLAGLDFATTFSLFFTQEQEAEVAGNAIVSLTNCTGPDVVACLSRVDAGTLVNLPTVARYVVVDNEFVLSPNLEVTGKGPVARVPTLWGTTADDGAAFIGFPQQGESLQSAIEAIALSPDLTAKAMSSGLFPQPNTGNLTLDIFNVTARIATDVEFRCLDQATIFSAIKHGVFSDVFYYEFDRSYQTPGFNPNAPVCQPPITATHPNGDPSLPYFKCHSGDLYYQFGTLGQFNLPFRDSGDLSFSQLVMDHWISFVRSHDPNPDPEFLLARGFTDSLRLVKQAGTWKKVTRGEDNVRRLALPSRNAFFSELEQCEVLELPLDFYETAL